MKRKIGSLGLSPVKAVGISHNGKPGSKGDPEYYLDDKINLNIVYSVYENPKTMEEIAENFGNDACFSLRPDCNAACKWISGGNKG